MSVNLVDFGRGATLVAATITMGLFAGLFYTFACGVMPGLARTDDPTFVASMQGINVAILNGWFGIGFFGAGLLTIAAGAFHAGRDAMPWIIAGFVLYAITFVITIAANVPLNNALVAAGETADPAGVRAAFEVAWVRWNLARAVVSTAGLGCLTWALVLYGRSSA